MPVIKGETVVNLRIKTSQQLIIWWVLLFIFQGVTVFIFVYVWRKTRLWLELPLLPPYWLGTMEEFFSAIVLTAFITYLATCFLLNAAYRPDKMKDEEFECRSKRILRKLFIFLGTFLLIDLIYMWFRWDLQEKLSDFYFWLCSLV